MSMINEEYELLGRTINVRREDLAFRSVYRLWSGPDHGKMGAIYQLLWAWSKTCRKVSCFASEGSNWAHGLALIAAKFDVQTRVYMSTTPSWASELKAAVPGVELVMLRPNFLPIMSSQARARSEADGFTFVPFGFENDIVMDYLTDRLDFEDRATVVLASGSGITLSCVIGHALSTGKSFRAIHAISSGRSEEMIARTILRHVLLPQWNICKIHKIGGYGASSTASLWPTHPFYERKAYEWLLNNIDRLEDPIWFLNM